MFQRPSGSKTEKQQKTGREVSKEIQHQKKKQGKNNNNCFLKSFLNTPRRDDGHSEASKTPQDHSGAPRNDSKGSEMVLGASSRTQGVTSATRRTQEVPRSRKRQSVPATQGDGPKTRSQAGFGPKMYQKLYPTNPPEEKKGGQSATRKYNC